MSGPNGDPDVSADDGIIEDEDEFSEEGMNQRVNYSLLYKDAF